MLVVPAWEAPGQAVAASPEPVELQVQELVELLVVSDLQLEAAEWVLQGLS